MTTGNVIILAVTSTALGLSLALGPAAMAGDRKDEKACAEVKTRIRVIQNRMRSGYTASQGIRYEERLRRLREKRRRVCR